LNSGALFNAEFGIRHRGSTVPERSGVALSFCRCPPFAQSTWRSLADQKQITTTPLILCNPLKIAA
jgi:hypothetical protein